MIDFEQKQRKAICKYENSCRGLYNPLQPPMKINALDAKNNLKFIFLDEIELLQYKFFDDFK
jgi:hypothetical protein